MPDTFPWEGEAIALFELTREFVYSDDRTQSPHSPEAQRIWFRTNLGLYGQVSSSSSETIHHPTALHSAAGEYFGLPVGRDGQHYWCWWNAESGRWEVFAPTPPTSYWGTVVEWLGPGQCSVRITVGGTARTVVVARYRTPESPAVSSTVRVDWFPEEDAWYVG